MYGLLCTERESKYIRELLKAKALSLSESEEGCFTIAHLGTMFAVNVTQSSIFKLRFHSSATIVASP